MDLVQEPVRHLGHMATKICSTCKLKWTRANFHGSQWAKRDNRMCMRCVNRRDDETTAAAPGIPVSLPEGQHGAHTSAAAAGAGIPSIEQHADLGQQAAAGGSAAAASAGAVEESGAASPPSPVLGVGSTSRTLTGTSLLPTRVVPADSPADALETPTALFSTHAAVGAGPREDSMAWSGPRPSMLPSGMSSVPTHHKDFSSDSASDETDSLDTRGVAGEDTRSTRFYNHCSQRLFFSKKLFETV